jgi:hypothetical protein
LCPVSSNVIKHARDREYMSGVDRDKARVKATGEVFTPTPLVQEILDQFEPEMFADPDKTFLDPSCGDGQFLSEALIRKVESGIDFEQALSTLYGVDLMPDNVKLCQDRLLCGREDLRHIVEQNIVCADGLKYHYRFDGTPPYSMTIDEYEAELERHRAEKHQMHKKVGGYRTEIAKLTERVRALEAQVKEQDIKKDIMASNGIDVVTS